MSSSGTKSRCLTHSRWFAFLDVLCHLLFSRRLLDVPPATAVQGEPAQVLEWCVVLFTVE